MRAKSMLIWGMPIFRLTVIFLLLATPLTAQVGGGSETLFEWISSTPSDLFGSSSSSAGDVNGDGFDDVIVGMALASHSGLTNAGSAFVYSGADGSVLFQFDGAIDAGFFGIAVSGAKDVNQDGFDDVIVGASGHSSTLWGAGSAHVFSGADGALLFQWEGLWSNDSFGRSVAGAGDVDGDGFPDMIVGAYSARPSFYLYPEPGAAYVFSGADGSLIYTFWGEDDEDYFGRSVSGAGDVNADGFDDLVIGANGTKPGWTGYYGSAYVYSGHNGSLLFQWDGTSSDSWLGSSVSDAGDINGDGFDDVIVGQPESNNSSGKAFVYSGNDGSVIYQWVGESVWDHFGVSVSNAGDVNGDNTDDIIVGAPRASQTGGYPLTGSVYVFSGSDGVLLHQRNGTRYQGRLGDSVSGIGDVDGDGLHDLISGGTGYGYGFDFGAVYVFNFMPYCSSNVSAIPVSAATQIDLQLDFPDTAASFDYKLLLSVSGPGQMFRGVDIPLTEDFMVHETYYGNYPFATHMGLHGNLDINGDATATVSIAANELHPGLIGRTIYCAATASMNGFSPAEYSSVAIPFEITP